MANLPPTKSNLIATKRSRELAETGFDLMDKKRNLLVRELVALIDQAKDIQDRTENTFSAAYAALSRAAISMGGHDRLRLLAHYAIEKDEGIGLKYRSVMGVELPAVTSGEIRMDTLPYGLLATTSVLDDAYVKFRKAKQLIMDLAETENAIFRLAYAIKKTQKRANALKNIVIPNLDATAQQIIDDLEEKEREEFVRLKVIKAQQRSREE